jgi:uncharacterized membrane protein YdbT with pleckstrin-like domain
VTRILREWILKILRVPSEPKPPVAARDILVFRASPNYYRYKIALWAIAQLGALLGLIAFLVFISRFDFDNRFLRAAILGAEWLSWGAYLIQLPFSFLLVRLDFEMRWYILSDRSLRIREGIVSLREKTMTFANIQQIGVRQNPLQRLLGLADVQVRTAGGGGGSGAEGGGKHASESMHEAWFRGVDNAEAVRSAIQGRVRQFRDSGLGDPDDAAGTQAPSIEEAVEAARALHQEVRKLRGRLLVEA